MKQLSQGAVLKPLIDARFAKRYEAAEAIGIDENRLSRLLNDKSNLSPKLAVTVSSVLGLPLQVLLFAVNCCKPVEGLPQAQQEKGVSMQIAFLKRMLLHYGYKKEVIDLIVPKEKETV